ncbi:MAG: hypothetical protein E7460_02400 [Ruminococcaceae bacterium]|nr:hypothetical protein [Oscillospiraceae bacterium]
MNFGMRVTEVGMQSPKRLRVKGTVSGDRLYRGDILEIHTEEGVLTACVQSIRDGRKRLTSADPGEEVSLILPGIKKDRVSPGAEITRSKLGSWRRIDFSEETELPVNVLLLKKAVRRYVNLCSENRLLIPVRIAVVVISVLLIGITVRRTLPLMDPAYGTLGPVAGIAVLLGAVIPSVMLAVLALIICRKMVRRHICFDNTPLRLTGDRIELSYRSGGATVKSEVFFSDIDSIEYYPRWGCVRVNAPVRITKHKNGQILGTKFERLTDRAFQVYFLIYMDNDLFLRSVSERSGVAVETVGTARPDVDGARY